MSLDKSRTQRKTYSLDQVTPFKLAAGLAIGGIVATAGFLATRYRVADPYQYLVKTGLGIADMTIAKTTFEFPFQKVMKIDLNPRTYHFSLHNMSKEKVEFNLPVVFTIGPISPVHNPEGFKLYAQNLHALPPKEVENVIKGIIEGESRGLTAAMTVEELFNSKERFKTEVVTKIQEDLDKLGLNIFNANIKEMSDYDEKNQYFSYRKQRAVETANYESQVEVAKERTRGTIGMKEQEKESRMTVASLDTQAVCYENERKAELEISNANLSETRAEAHRRTALANLEATMSTKLRESELKTTLEAKRFNQILEQLRADLLTTSRVAAEQRVAEAEGEAQYICKLADANCYEAEQNAKAIQSTLLGHSAGLRGIIEACNHDNQTARFYLALKDGLFEKIAIQQASAVQGLQPKISVWNTGSDQDSQSATKPVLKLVQSFAPMLDGLHNHTDFRAPSWMRNVEETSVKE